jgi:hypothetical protein
MEKDFGFIDGWGLFGADQWIDGSRGFIGGGGHGVIEGTERSGVNSHIDGSGGFKP